MADLLAGTRVLAEDTPPCQYATDSTAQTDISTTTSEGSPAVSVTFVAPTTGRVHVTVGGGGNASSGAARAFFEPEIYLGTDSSGTQVIGPNAITLRGFGTSPGATTTQYGSRRTMVTGLTPGATYFARVMIRRSGGTSADVAVREISVEPAS